MQPLREQDGQHPGTWCAESGFRLRWDQSSSPTSLTWWPISGTWACVELMPHSGPWLGSRLELGSGRMEGSRSPLPPTIQDLARAAVSGWAVSIVTEGRGRGAATRWEDRRASRVQDVIQLPGAASAPDHGSLRPCGCSRLESEAAKQLVFIVQLLRPA